MGWRPSSWWARSRDRQPIPEAPSTPVVPSAEAAGAGPPQAWRDLPVWRPPSATALQRVAVSDEFPAGLASHADPRFLRPLSHQVDPSVGGLVDGLVVAGSPTTHDGGPELSVPVPRAQPPAPVQRRVTWTGPDDLTTVRWELPDVPADTGIAEVAGAADAPALGASTGIEAHPVEAAGPEAMPGPRTMGSEAPQPSRPELPAVVQRTPATPTPSLPTASPLLAAPPLPAGSPPPAPAPRGLVADAGPGLSESPLLGSDHDHAHRPTAPDPVVSTAAVDPSAAVPVVARSVLSEPPAPALSAAVTGSPDPLQPSEPAVESDQQELSSSPGWTEVALPVPASPLSGGSVPGAPSAPEISLASPPVSSPLPTTAAAASLSPTVSRLAGAAPATAGLSPSTSSPPARTDVGPGSAPVQRSVVVGTAVRPPTAPAPPSGSRPSLEPEAHVPATRSIPWGESTEPIGATESTEELERPIIGTGGVSELSSTTAADSGTTSDPFGGAVISLTSVQRQPAPAAGPGARPAAATPVVARPRPETGSPLAIGAPLVQRSSVPGPPTPSPAVEVSGVARSFASMFGGPGAGASGATAGTADTVQAAAVAIAAPSGRTVPGVQRRSLDDASSGVDDGAAATPEPAGPTADTAVDGAALTTGSTAATTTPAAPAGAAPAPTDLDEMARRLYEPLVARLRAELWLDRERAGVFGDG